MQIFIAADHAGYELKRELKEFLKAEGYTVHDEGFFEFNEDDDYPDVVTIVAKHVGRDPAGSRGIVIGGSGQGEAMCANRVRGVRAAVLYSYHEDIVRFSRVHNDANVLALGARFISAEDSKRALQLWLTTDASEDERYQRRNLKLDGAVAMTENEF